MRARNLSLGDFAYEEKALLFFIRTSFYSFLCIQKYSIYLSTETLSLSIFVFSKVYCLFTFGYAIMFSCAISTYMLLLKLSFYICTNLLELQSVDLNYCLPCKSQCLRLTYGMFGFLNNREYLSSYVCRMKVQREVSHTPFYLWHSKSILQYQSSYQSHLSTCALSILFYSYYFNNFIWFKYIYIHVDIFIYIYIYQKKFLFIF